MFLERDTGPGDIYIEATDKLMVKKLREITFVNAKEIFGIIYSSKTGNTILKWRQLKNNNRKLEAELRSLKWASHSDVTSPQGNCF